MNIRFCALAVFASVLLSGCAGPGPTGKYKDEVEVKAGTTAQKMVEYRDQVALLQNQSKAACDMLKSGQITFEQYQSEVREVRTQLTQLRSKVTE